MESVVLWFGVLCWYDSDAAELDNLSGKQRFGILIKSDVFSLWKAVKNISIKGCVKKWEYYLEAVKNFYITFIFIELMKTWAIKNSCP